jgi:EpsI family protein
MQLGAWQGEESEIKDVLNQGLDATLALDRVYRKSSGELVYVHMAAFDHFRQLAHHHPRVCYRGAGWEAVKSEVLPIPGVEPKSSGLAPVCEVITFANKTGEIYVLYWYQVGEFTTYRPDGVRTLWWRVRDRKPLPPQVKVLMQASAPDIALARAAMLELAEPIYQWIRKACTEGLQAPASSQR